MKKIIYTDDVYTYMNNNTDSILEYLNDNEIEPHPNNKEDAALQLMDDDYLHLTDLINNFDKTNNNKILVCGVLSLWYGSIKVKKNFDSLFNAVFKCYEDVNEFYFLDNKSTLTLNAAHHDGVNTFKFYKVVNGKKRAITFNDLMRC